MRRKQLGGIALLITLGAASVLIAATVNGAAAASPGTAPAKSQAGGQKKPLRWETHDLYIEYNATDGDAGLQMSLDNEPAWNRFRLRDPRGRKLMVVKGKSRLRGFGLGNYSSRATNRPSAASHSAPSRGASRKAGTSSEGARSTAADWSAPTASPTECPTGRR